MKSLQNEIYEPEHESGPTCWCKPKVSGYASEMHIEHNEERIRIPALIKSVLDDVEECASQQDNDYEIKGMLRAVEMIRSQLKL